MAENCIRTVWNVYVGTMQPQQRASVAMATRRANSKGIFRAYSNRGEGGNLFGLPRV